MSTPAHRGGTRLLRLRDAAGGVLADTDVELAQVSHAFGFGCAAFDLLGLDDPGDGSGGPVEGAEVWGGAAPERAADLAALWHGVFDTATLPFYWAGVEPERGRPRTAAQRATARRLGERGVRVKGHPLVWHTLAPDWLRALPTDEVAAVVADRVRREVGDLAGLVHEWDVVNELVIMPVFANEPGGAPTNAITRLAHERGRVELARSAFAAAREADPGAVLVLNDFDLSTGYECLVEGLLEAGVRIDALGLQTHMHQGWWGEERVLAVLDRFARFGLPLQLTETTLLSGALVPPEVDDLNDHVVETWPSTPDGEARQADEVARHYRCVVAHPAVQSVTWWSLTDEGAWLGAPAGLVRSDATPKPAYDALRDLVRGEWWLPPTPARTDPEGLVALTGWWGTHEVRLHDRVARVDHHPAPDTPLDVVL